MVPPIRFGSDRLGDSIGSHDTTEKHKYFDLVFLSVVDVVHFGFVEVFLALNGPNLSSNLVTVSVKLYPLLQSCFR